MNTSKRQHLFGHHISTATFAFETTYIGTVFVLGFEVSFSCFFFFNCKEYMCMNAHTAFDYKKNYENGNFMNITVKL